MANEVINLDTVFSGFNSGTDLQPKNTRTNNQGVKINDIAGFVKIVSTAPATEDLIKGDMFFALDTSLLTVCTVTGTTLLSIELV
tara:strand:- start:375 stop:629 length:255 start_codon:yes stop_codon:yes gene_type:complete